MSAALVLTDGARVQCAHMAAPVGAAQGITFSSVAKKITVDGAKPLLQGVTISGFTTAAGCVFNVSGAPKPCMSFVLSVPASGKLAEGGLPVYSEADLAAIALVPSTGNANPGLTIHEVQQKLKA